ncbi:Rv3235 family protein [Actinosynnema sp. NPDC050436]|uniref:Rv3235 family protein n=1 Tax=Actinosynnema sp. NPDC050436 TaxID=3155659 RepID=UPI0033CF0570
MSPPVRVLRARTPAAHRRAHRLVTAVVEAVSGRRPHRQVARVLAAPAEAGVGRAAAVLRTARLGVTRLCPTSGQAAELSGVLVSGRGRVRALAARIEWADDRWWCTEFHVLP